MSLLHESDTCLAALMCHLELTGSPQRLERPLWNEFPSVPKCLIQDSVARLVRRDHAPERFGMVHVGRMAELVNQHIANEVGGKKQQFRVKRKITLP